MTLSIGGIFDRGGGLIVAARKTRESYQFKVVQHGISPPIWRQFQVWEDATLAQLHRILRMMMGWENYHLYEFRIGGRIYGDPDLDDEREIIDAKKTRIRNVLPDVGAEFEYEYNFGDDWQHDLLLEAVMQSRPDTMCPRCLAGERSCPPEDVGGSGGYADYLEALADPDHEEHQNMMEWRGSFDPETFSIEKVNRELERKFRPVRKKAVRLPLPQPSADKRGTPNAELLPQAILSKPVSLQRQRIRIGPNETVPLELNERERDLILSHTFADESLTNRLRVVPKKSERPFFRFTLDDLDELVGFLAAKANHAPNKILREQLHELCDRIEATLNKYTDEATIN
jgi:hypothetical protein